MTYSWDKVWKIKVENKCKFFLWLLPPKLLTVDWIIKRGGQANPVCQLRRTRNKSMMHMVANCYYSKRVLQLIEQQIGKQNTHPQQPVSNLKSW
jgi:cell division inhibitor SulA